MFKNNIKNIEKLRQTWKDLCCKTEDCVFSNFNVCINPNYPKNVFVFYTITELKPYSSEEQYWLINKTAMFSAKKFDLLPMPVFYRLIDKQNFEDDCIKIYPLN